MLITECGWETGGAEIFGRRADAGAALGDGDLSTDIVVALTKASDWRPVGTAGLSSDARIRDGT